jgi:hypothetical protein
MMLGKTGLTFIAAAAISLLATSVGFAEPVQVWLDHVCVIHRDDTNPFTHDPKIAAQVQEFAVRLLTGDPAFMVDWNDFLHGLLKDGAPGTTSNDRVADASTDLHCLAPIEARVTPAGSNSSALDVDDWRSHATLTAFQLGTHKINIEQGQDQLNKVRSEDKTIAAADFTRDCLFARVPLQAKVNSAGAIEITDSPSPQP